MFSEQNNKHIIDNKDNINEKNDTQYYLESKEETIKNGDEDKEEYLGEENKVAYKYFFLDTKSNQLAKTFGDFHNDYVNKMVKIHLCIYKMNLGCETPFIEVLIENNSFPVISNFVTPNSNSDSHTNFIKQCMVQLLQILDINDEFGIELFENMYKGFIEKNDDIFVVFESFSNNQNNLQWVILDEILYRDGNVHDVMKSFFRDNKFMTQIFRDEEYIETYPLPSLMFLCEKTDTYHNLTQESIIDLKDTSVSWLGNYYYFSSYILKKEANVNIQRYAVFTENATYILRDIALITDKQKQIFLDNNKDNDIVIIYYIENDIQLWCVKSNSIYTRI
jgi:hypothetical protein